MRGITVRQPWAWAISIGAKTVENRSQRTNYRGLLAIHAGGAWSERGAHDPRILAEEHRWGGRHEFHYGAVIAIGELEDCHQDTGCCRPWGESNYVEAGGNRRTLIWHYVLADIRPVDPPIAIPGRLGLWHVPADVRAELEEVLTGG